MVCWGEEREGWNCEENCDLGLFGSPARACEEGICD